MNTLYYPCSPIISNSSEQLNKGRRYKFGVDPNPSAIYSASTEEITETVVRPTPTVVDIGNHISIYLSILTWR